MYTTDKNGILKGGGFTITSDLLNDTIRNSSVNSNTTHLDEKNRDRNQDSNINGNIQQGGSFSVGANVLNMFKDLAVPAGLFFTQKQFQKNNTMRYEQKEEPIEDGLYDKLLGLLDPEKRMLYGRKTKRKREINKRKTRKERK